MDNQLPPTENMSVSAISAMANVKEVSPSQTHYLHIFLLIGMILFAIFVVSLSVINFDGFVTTKTVKVIHAQTSHSDDVQKLTNQ